MHPFEWPYPKIPFLPRKMFDYLHCPTPFFIGIEEKYLRDALEIDALQDVVCVELDNDVVRVPGDIGPDFPTVWKRELLLQMRSLFFHDFSHSDDARSYASPPRTGSDSSLNTDDAAAMATPPHFAPSVSPSPSPSLLLTAHTQLRMVFFKMWVDLLQGYRQFCSLLHDDRDPVLLFDVPSFLNVKSPSYVNFLRQLFHTQCFQVFLTQRSDRIFGLRPLEGIVLPLSHHFGRELEDLRQILENRSYLLFATTANDGRLSPSSSSSPSSLSASPNSLSERLHQRASGSGIEKCEEGTQAAPEREEVEQATLATEKGTDESVVEHTSDNDTKDPDSALERKNSDGNVEKLATPIPTEKQLLASTSPRRVDVGLTSSSSMGVMAAERLDIPVPYLRAIFDVSEYVCAAMDMSPSSPDHPLLHVVQRGFRVASLWERRQLMTVSAVAQALDHGTKRK